MGKVNTSADIGQRAVGSSKFQFYL